jgi:hypothetical protein
MKEKLLNEVLHTAYSSPSIIKQSSEKKNKITGYLARIGEIRDAYKLIPEGKQRLRIPGKMGVRVT